MTLPETWLVLTHSFVDWHDAVTMRSAFVHHAFSIHKAFSFASMHSADC